jgi:glucosyl-3-phosphoglycerate phosphatase
MLLLRHGQSEFNLHFTATRVDPGIEDPPLTPLGRAQAEAAARALEGQGLRQIIVSPYTRALQTAEPIAARLGLPLRVHPTVRERCHFACDIGTEIRHLRAAWPHLDFSGIPERWWPDGSEPEHEVTARAQAFRTEIAASGAWDTTLVVSHWAFIRALSGETLQNGEWIRLQKDVLF